MACVGALRVESTGIIDFPAICAALVRSLDAADLRLSTPALGIRPGRGGGVEIATGTDIVRADALVNCAGLHSDRVARLAGLSPRARIVPFRGEYFTLRPESAHLVRGLIYPVPDASLPFLGVHLTRMLDGSVHAGPNAVLALRREGYRWRDVSAADLAETLRFPGLWRLARRYPRTAVDEVARSLSRRRFARSLARLVPAIGREDLVRAARGRPRTGPPPGRHAGPGLPDRDGPEPGPRAQRPLPRGHVLPGDRQARGRPGRLTCPQPPDLSTEPADQPFSSTLTGRLAVRGAPGEGGGRHSRGAGGFPGFFGFLGFYRSVRRRRRWSACGVLRFWARAFSYAARASAGRSRRRRSSARVACHHG